MKVILYVYLFFLSLSCFAQTLQLNQEKLNRWSISTSYGYAFFTSQSRSLNPSKSLQNGYELEIDYTLKNDASIGFSFLNFSSTSTHNQIIGYTFGNKEFDIIFDNFQDHVIRDIFEIHYKNYYLKKKLFSAFGIYVFNDKTNNYDSFALTFRGYDYYYFGISLTLGYLYPMNDFVDFGIKARGMFSFDGNDAMLLPTITVSF